MRNRRLLSCVAAVVIAAAPALAGGVAEPSGYRMDHYHAPVPDTLAGAEVVDTKAARALWEAGETAFVDVFPRPPKPANLPEGTLWIDKPRRTIEGAMWLPNTGYGRAPPGMDDYLAAGLAAATGGDRDRPVLFFCRDDCWMSWNAARRAMLELGYTRVYWYPAGMDGWGFEDLPARKIQPWSP